VIDINSSLVVSEFGVQLSHCIIENLGNMRGFYGFLQEIQLDPEDITQIVDLGSLKPFLLLASSIIESSLCASIVFAIDNVEEIWNGSQESGLYSALYHLCDTHLTFCRVAFTDTADHGLGAFAPLVKRVKHDAEYQGKNNSFAAAMLIYGTSWKELCRLS
jgi:hypothetical protein